MTNRKYSQPWRPGSATLTGGTAGDIPVCVSQLKAALGLWIAWAAICLLALWLSPATAQSLEASGDEQTMASRFQHDIEAMLQSEPALAVEGSSPSAKPRVEVVLGQLNARLKLAPCQRISTYLPQGARLWGRTHVGMRCEQGAVAWNVYWPVTVKVWMPAVVAAVPLRPGSLVAQADLRVAEVDVAASNSPALTDPQLLIGRAVTRMISAGEAVRAADIKQRRWFAAGEPVTVLVQGNGFAASARGVAISHGDEGQCARIRMDGQRVLCAQPVGDRQAEVLL
jgi:flagellar basal body P-ring formation protein FlgA